MQILRLHFWLTESETWGWWGRAKFCFQSSRWSWFILVFEHHCFRASFQKTVSAEGYLDISGEMGVEWPAVPFVQDWRLFQMVFSLKTRTVLDKVEWLSYYISFYYYHNKLLKTYSLKQKHLLFLQFCRSEFQHECYWATISVNEAVFLSEGVEIILFFFFF